MLTYEVECANFDSWGRTLLLIEQQPDNETWIPYKAFVRRIFQLGAMELLCSYFRAGQAMHEIVFSTCERHGLELYDPPPPRVTVVWNGGEPFVAASYANVSFHEPTRKTQVTPETAWPVLKSYLIELWKETRPEEPLPKALMQAP